MKFLPCFFLIAIMLSCLQETFSQSKPKNLVYVDKKGILRYTKDNKEAAFFGVNYTTPFAYAYRAHKALDVDIEKAIEQDVYQMARLGLDAFRVHVWDTEISDTAGNLLENEHLRLFDFLLAELKKRNIKTIITPIAFWGNGYPERDEATPGFSRKYGKGRATTNDTAIVAQENYLKQFFRHINAYTKQTYVDDADVIAVELNNEPSHSGTKEAVTAYINRLVKAMKNIGWTKPLYYNIAQNPYYADAVSKANVDGVSFQWYPTGLVANHEQEGNFLPNVDHYPIPYDTIPEYRNKSKMVYEFDAADVSQSYMYPTIARSFREAGFQWATQFAYDPTALAYANTEYQTHYLNLLYTPSKAISLLIASKAFHKLPRLKSFGSYPADSSFDVFRVSYKNSLSEMNNAEEFYYSNSTDTKPVDISKLKHIAGVGSSSLVRYGGTGTDFLDKESNGRWRLEVMPDAIHVHDPFERASPKKKVTIIEWNENSMWIGLPEFKNGFRAITGFKIIPIDSGNSYRPEIKNNSFLIRPGTYLIVDVTDGPRYGINSDEREFHAMKSSSAELFLRHEPFKEVSAGKSFAISAQIVGLDSGKATIQINKLGGGFGSSRMIPMIRKSSSEYSAEVPSDFVTNGALNYKIVLQKGNAFAVFPGNHKENPFAWDNYNSETWQTFVVPENAKLEIFNPTFDHNAKIYPALRRGFQSGYITGSEPNQLILQLSANQLTGDHTFGFVQYCADKLKGRSSEINSFDKLVIRARTSEAQSVKAKITLIDKNAFAFSSSFTLSNNFQDIEIPVNELKPDSMILLPRAYPEFMPLWFKATGESSFNLSEIEKAQVTVGSDLDEPELKKPYSLEVASIWLQKKK
jgi:hypothetical protein